MASLSSSNALHVAPGRMAGPMSSLGSHEGMNREHSMPQPPRAYSMQSSPQPRGGYRNMGPMRSPVSAAPGRGGGGEGPPYSIPPGFRAKLPPGFIPMKAPPTVPLKHIPSTSPHPHPLSTSARAHKIMMPPGMMPQGGYSGAAATMARPSQSPAMSSQKKFMMVPLTGPPMRANLSAPSGTSLSGSMGNPSPSPQPTTPSAEATSTTADRSHKSLIQRGFNSFVNLLGHGTKSSQGREQGDKLELHSREASGLAAHGGVMGSSPTRNNTTLIPNNHPGGHLSPKQPPGPLHSRSSAVAHTLWDAAPSGSATTAGAQARVQSNLFMAMQSPQNSGAFPGAANATARPLRPPSSRSSSVVTPLRQDPPPTSSPQLLSERLSRAVSQPHTQLVPAASLPSPAPTAAVNAVRVPSAAIIKEGALPEVGVLSIGHRLHQLGESSEDSDSQVSLDGALADTVNHDDAIQHAEDPDVSAKGPDPETNASAGATIAEMTAATPSVLSLSPRGDKKLSTHASRSHSPVRQAAATAARSATAAVKQQEEEGTGAPRGPRELHQTVLEAKKLRSTQRTHPLQPSVETHAVREAQSPSEEDDTQKPSSVDQNCDSVTSTTLCRPLPSPSPDASIASAAGRAENPRSTVRGRGDAGGGALSGPTQKRKRPDTPGHAHRPPSKIDSRRASSQRRSSDDEKHISDNEANARRGLRDLSTRDLYRLANILRDTNTSPTSGNIYCWQRHNSRHGLYGSEDSDADTDSDGDGSWGHRRPQRSSQRSRSMPPANTVGVPWRYTGTHHSSNLFASPPRVRRPLGYINVGGGRYERVGGSPYTRHQSRHRAVLAGANRRQGSLSGSWRPGVPPLLQDDQHLSVAPSRASAFVDSRQESSRRGGGVGSSSGASLHNDDQQRQPHGSHRSQPRRRPTGAGSGSTTGIGLDDTVLSAADSQHPYCLPTPAMLPLSQSISPLRDSPAGASGQGAQQYRRESSPRPGLLLRQELGQPYSVSRKKTVSSSAPADTKPVASLNPKANKTNQSVGHSARCPVAEVVQREATRSQPATPVSAGAVSAASAAPSTSIAVSQKAQTRGTAAPGRARTRSPGSRPHTSLPSAQGQTHTGRSNSHTAHADPNASCTPLRKQELTFLSRETVARLSTPQPRRGVNKSAIVGVSPISRRSQSGGTVQTCSKWIDEMLASSTVKFSGVRTGGCVGETVAAPNTIPLVDLRHEFKPRITGGSGPGSARVASPSLHDGDRKDYTLGFTGSRARAHIPGISFKSMTGARSATGSPPRQRGTAASTGAGAARMKTVAGLSGGMPYHAYSSIRIHDPARKSPWALAPERENFRLLPGKPALSRRRRISAIGDTTPENSADDTQPSTRDSTRIVVEEVHLDEHNRPYLKVRPLPTSEEMEAQRAAVERLSRPKPVHCRPGDLPS